MTHAPPLLHVVLVGSVDHGKSTLLGRLMHDTGAVSPVRVAQIEAASRRRGVALEWSFLLDSFQAERDQAITIDTTEVRVTVDGRTLAFIDAPGHVEFLGNLVSGVARAEAAVLVVDAEGAVDGDLRRHCALLKLVGVEDIVVAVNKIDRCADADDAFRRAAANVLEHLAQWELRALAVVPTIARTGANVVARAGPVAAYSGPSLIEALLAITPQEQAAGLPLRLPVQDVYREGDARQVAGRLATGTLAPGQTVLLLPSGRTTRVMDMHPARAAVAGDNVTLRLADDAFAERGDMIVDPASAPKLTRVFDADVFWLDAAPLAVGQLLRVRLGTADVEHRVQAIRWRLAGDGSARTATGVLDRFDVGGLTLRAAQPRPVDDGAICRETARLVLLRGSDAAGIGIASTAGYPDLRLHAAADERDRAQAQGVTPSRRAPRQGRRGMVVWLTGLSGAGKSTLAVDLEERLIRAGCAAYVLDGDILRQGLSADLGFDPDARRENVRRTGEVAALFADAGLVCIVALISPYRDDRERARLAARDHPFCEVFVDAPLEVCEARDPKGLYRKARAAMIKGFTGIDAPYERPDGADLVLKTGERSLDECGSDLIACVRLRLGLE